MKDWIYQATGKAWMALLIGIGMLGWAGYAQFKANADTHGAAVEALVSKSGTIMGGTEVTETNKRRRGGSRTHRYFELEAKVGNGGTEKWRVDYAVERRKLEGLIDETVEVRVDPSESNLVYEIKHQGATVVSLQDMQKIMADHDRAAASAATSRSSLIVGAGALLLGIVGLFLRRRIGRADDEAAQAPVQTPAIGEKV